MPELNHFQFDVFLSYGWSGLETTDDGDRAWMNRFRHTLQNELSGFLGRRARVFLDVEQPRNGDLETNLKQALRSSALFLAVITPGACRANSWCHWEVETFLKSRSEAVPPDRQVFVAILRDPIPATDALKDPEHSRNLWPKPLGQFAPYEFLDADRMPLEAPDSSQDITRLPAGRLTRRIAADMRSAMCDLQMQISHNVMLSHSESVAPQKITRIANEVARLNGRLLRSQPLKNETETDFCVRTEQDLRFCGLSIHLLQASDVDCKPKEWRESPQQHQLRLAGGRFASEKGQIVWEGSPGNAVSKIDAGTYTEILEGTGFESLASVIVEGIQNVTAVAEHTVFRWNASADPEYKYLFIDCVEADLAVLERVRPYLHRKKIKLKPPLFQGDPEIRRARDQENLGLCSGVAVLWGSRSDLETNEACRTLAIALAKLEQEEGTQQRPTIPTTHCERRPRMIILNPHTDPIRKNFCYPKFSNLPLAGFPRKIAQMLEND
jgi:hypothetical protein